MEEILVITGLPRSGTSLMMQIINRTSIPVLSDGKRLKDVNNPEGYFELEAVKGIVRDNSFLKQAIGKAIKIVAPLPIYMDPELKYRVIFMRRDVDEILRSQEVMLQKDQINEREKFRTMYDLHLKKTYSFLKEHEIPYLDVNYLDLIEEPETLLSSIIDFCSVDHSVIDLVSAIKPELYRNRK